MTRARFGPGQKSGFALIELMLALALTIVVVTAVGRNFLEFSRAFTTLAKLMYTNTRAQLVVDRLLEELVTGNFASLAPAVPVNSNSIEFQKIVGVIDGDPVFGNTIHIELVPLESDITDGVDNNGNGLIDEGGIQIWQDLPPYGPTPGVEDLPVLICSKVAPGGLKFTRQGSVLLIDLTFQEVLVPGEAPRQVHIASSVKMRNG